MLAGGRHTQPGSTCGSAAAGNGSCLLCRREQTTDGPGRKASSLQPQQRKAGCTSKGAHQACQGCLFLIRGDMRHQRQILHKPTSLALGCVTGAHHTPLQATHTGSMQATPIVSMRQGSRWPLEKVSPQGQPKAMQRWPCYLAGQIESSPSAHTPPPLARTVSPLTAGTKQKASGYGR